MGCDIHIFTEALKTINDKPTWANIDNWRLNPYYEAGNPYETQYTLNEICGSRNYSLFSTLAGVRDYSEKIQPVSDPKGLPEDMSRVVAEAAEQWDGDGHTHSWLTLAELKKYQAGKPMLHYTGLLSPQQAKAFDETGKTPNSWCQGTNQEDYTRREWSEESTVLEPLIKELQQRMKDEFWIWDENYDPKFDEKIRIVFWFDN